MSARALARVCSVMVPGVKRKEYFNNQMTDLNNRGQVNIFNVLFVAMIFIGMMALGLGKLVNSMIGIGVTAGNVVGIEAFFLNNFILWILLAFILWFMIATSQG